MEVRRDFNNSHPELAERLRLITGGDVARISSPLGKLFLIIGWKRRSEGEWTCNRKPMTFDFVEERCVASGNSEDELTASAREYKRLSGLTKEEWLAELMATNKPQEG